MIRLVSTFLFAFLFCTVGCRTGDGHFGPPSSHNGSGASVKVTGALVKKEGATEYTWIEFAGVKFDREPIKFELPTNYTIDTPHILKVEMEQERENNSQSYTALIGPNYSGRPANFEIQNSPEVKTYVGTGLAFVWGSWPVVRSRSVRISSPASAPGDPSGGRGTIIFEEAQDAGVYFDRVYNVADARSTEVVITCDSTGASIVDSLRPGYYVEIEGCSLKGPAKKYEDDNARKTFVLKTIRDATEAGYRPDYP